VVPKDFYNIYKSFEIAEDFHKYFSKNKLLKEYVNNSSLNKNI